MNGYKFHIFYHDLIDKSDPPQYRVEDDPRSPNNSIVIFSSGAPYEEIGFKILKGFWEFSHKRVIFKIN